MPGWTFNENPTIGNTCSLAANFPRFSKPSNKNIHVIETLTLKNIATYDSTGIRIDNMKKVNFVYGANGCGKTTITKFIDNQTDPLFCNCSLIWKSGIPVKALVYNKDFRLKNFGKGSMDGVFTLGQATKEEIEAIKRMQDELSDMKEKGIKKKEAFEKLKNTKEETENEFKEITWTSILYVQLISATG